MAMPEVFTALFGFTHYYIKVFDSNIIPLNMTPPPVMYFFIYVSV